MTHIGLVSAYDAASHRQWWQGLRRNLGDYRWTVVTLPPRHFNWRIRGNPLSLSVDHRERLLAGMEVLLCTSMVDLATLRGLMPPLAAIPNLLYFHENQFAYPQPGNGGRLEPLMVNLYGALAADGLVFNSAYNRDSFCDGVGQLLGRMPDQVPAGVVDVLRGKSRVIPVPIETDCFAARRRRQAISWEEPVIVWNHRWEYDKAPERLYALLRCLQQQSGRQWRINIIGPQFRREPEIFQQIKAEFAPWIAHWGMAGERRDYLDILASSHVVISTAIHDFQGISVLEAAAAGCIPVVPDRLAYREWIPPDYRYASHLDDMAAEAQSMAALLERLRRQPPPGLDLTHLGWPGLVSRYRELIDHAIEGFSPAKSGT